MARSVAIHGRRMAMVMRSGKEHSVFVVDASISSLFFDDGK
jgi:hypothetical protein